MSNVTSIQKAFAAADERKIEWPEPTPLPFTLLPVPTFDRSLLPTELAPWLIDIAERLNVPMDFVAIPAMIAAGSVIGARIGVRPQAHTDWTEPANLWGCIVGSPGVLKSPAVSEVLAPLRRLDARANEAFLNEMSHFETSAAVHKLAKAVAEKQATKALQGKDRLGAESIMAAAGAPTPPKAKRFIVMDATVEKLGEICGDNPEGILFYRDELLTLLKDLDQEEKAAARGFIMNGWIGKDWYDFDRIGRGTVRIPRVNISMLGTTQPALLANYIGKCLTDRDDGMVQRLQLLVYPDLTTEWTDVDRPPNKEAKATAYACFERLANLSAADVGAVRDDEEDQREIPYLRFDERAIRLFLHYRDWLERTVREEDMPSALAAHLSKYRGLIPRLALIYHLASGGRGPISESAVASALEWAEYLEAHARRAYGSLSMDNGACARAIWRRIERGELSDGFTERDIYKRCWSNLQKGSRLSEALKLLVDNDWLAVRPVGTGGRPTIAYAINPRARATPLALAA